MNYIYIGKYYHRKNKEMPKEVKFGVTNNLSNREIQLNRTNSPIGYVITDAWEVPNNIKREDVELMIENIFSDQKYSNCEWYDVDPDYFREKIKAHFELLKKMTSNQYFNFVEVDLDNVEGQNDTEQKQERKKVSDLEIIIEGQKIEGFYVKDKFGKFFDWAFNNENVDSEKLKLDHYKIIKDNADDMPEYLRGSRFISLDNGLYLNTNSCTSDKCNIINKIITEYNLDASCVILD
jgi:hypothetical protein